MKSFQYRQNSTSLSPWVSVLILLALLTAFFFVAQYVYKFLFIISPIVIIATMILDYRVFVNYGRLLMAFLKQNVVVGASMIVLSAFLFPVIAAFLLGKAIIKRKIGKMQEQIYRDENTFTNYEEVDDPVINVSKNENAKKYDYNKLFEDV